MSLKVVFGDASEFANPLTDKAVAILTGIGVSITDHKVLGVVDGR